MMATPSRPLPAPKRISANPAASASLITVHGTPSCFENSPQASMPIQVESMFAAVRTTPVLTTPGTVTPITDDPPRPSTSCATVWATRSGVAG